MIICLPILAMKEIIINKKGKKEEVLRTVYQSPYDMDEDVAAMYMLSAIEIMNQGTNEDIVMFVMDILNDREDMEKHLMKVFHEKFDIIVTDIDDTIQKSTSVSDIFGK